MKINKIIMVVLLCLFAYGAAAQKKNKNKKKEEVTFSVPIDCQGCVDKINKNIAFEKGVKRIKCNLEQKTVKITYRKDKTDIENLKKGFAKIGYTNVSVKTENNPEKQPAEKSKNVETIEEHTDLN